MIIHISGTPGSGKTTLGEKLQKIYGDKIIVYDTDEFIQHHNEAGRRLLTIKKEASVEEYMKVWREILHTKINEFVTKNKDIIIVFTGILNNFSADDTIFEIKADHKFILDVPINIILKRYYTRLCETESPDYWNKVANNEYSINSSKEIINSNQKDITWHLDHGYALKDDNEIINQIGNIITNNKGGYYKKYVKYKTKYIKKLYPANKNEKQ